MGGFIGDAFITPVFLGMQALTALFFIMVQHVWLGLMALGVVGIQFTIIPRMRRELLRLGKQRQLASRELAGRIAEVSDGIEVVQVHNSFAWERAEIGQRLFQLFDLRLRIYNRKFIVKFVNNFLSQLTPFFFYSVGGYLAIRGTLDIGQLVAVIAAYRELPPPLKELIDWDQQRLDVQVKYDQVAQHFSEERLAPLLFSQERAEEIPELEGALVAEELRVQDPHGGAILNDASFEIALPAEVALISGGMSGASILAQILARRVTSFSGRIRIGEWDLRQIPSEVAGRRLAYAGVDPILFPGSIRDNLVYGLRYKPLGQYKEDEREAASAHQGGAADRQSDRKHRRRVDRLRHRRGEERRRPRPHSDRPHEEGRDGHRDLPVRSRRPHRSRTRSGIRRRGSWRRGIGCARLSRPRACPISSSRSIRSSSTTNPRSPKTCSSACPRPTTSAAATWRKIRASARPSIRRACSTISSTWAGRSPRP